MITRIVQIAAGAALIAGTMSTLPQLLQSIQLAELRILKATETRNWGRQFQVPVRSRSLQILRSTP